MNFVIGRLEEQFCVDEKKKEETVMKALQKVSKFLSDYTSVVVIAIAVVTFFVPTMMGWVNNALFVDPVSNKFTCQSIIIGVIMFSMGLTLTTEDFKILAQRPFDICIGAIAQYLIMPFLAFALMTVAILPVALVYSELASLFHTSGGELIYNTVGINKHVGFLASWLIMAAWISVPPAVVMAIMTWVNKTFALGLGTWQMVGCAAVLLVLYFFMSIQNVQFLVKAQAGMLFCNITVTILTGFILLFSGHWHISNFGNIFQS